MAVTWLRHCYFKYRFYIRPLVSLLVYKLLNKYKLLTNKGIVDRPVDASNPFLLFSKYEALRVFRTCNKNKIFQLGIVLFNYLGGSVAALYLLKLSRYS